MDKSLLIHVVLGIAFTGGIYYLYKKNSSGSILNATAGGIAPFPPYVTGILPPQDFSIPSMTAEQNFELAGFYGGM